MRRLVVIAIACVSMFFVAPSTTSASTNGETTCVGVVTGVHDNVVVPQGATCVLSGATVRGNVKALKNSTLLLTFDTVHGNVVGDGANQVSGGHTTVDGNFEGGNGTEIVECDRCTVRGNIIATGGVVDNPGFDARIGPGTTVLEGNVQFTKMVGDVNVIETSVLKGNVQLTENFIPAKPPGSFNGLNVVDSFIAQDLQVIKNRGPGPKEVANNTVGQSLQCFENDPPFIGGPNTAPKKEGQCF